MTSLTFPAQLAASQKKTVEEILQTLATANLVPTQHRQSEAPNEPPTPLAAAGLVYVRKGGHWPATTSSTTLQRPQQGVGQGA